MAFSCARCGSKIGKYRIEVYRIEDDVLVQSRDYCSKCIKEIFFGDINAAVIDGEKQ